MTRFLKKNGIRTIIQMALLAVVLYWWVRAIINPRLFVDFEAYCPMGGIQSMFTFLDNGALACSMSGMQLVLGVTLLIAVLLFSKLFCAYICPLGTISEWFGKLGRKMKIQATIPPTADKLLRVLKYVLLGITFYFTLASNELFCKEYDPFYAAASRFGEDVVPWMAISAMLVLAIGSTVIPMFWCRYVCPLGAFSNLFKHIYIVLTLVIGYAIIYSLKIEVSWIYLLISLFIAGYFFEVLLPEKTKSMQVMKITRNSHSCIDCGLCSKKCPQGIDVASLEVVNHADCNLCGDCLGACPVSDTLQVNQKNNFRWMPVAALFVLVLGGIYLGNKLEVPTVNMKWADDEVVANAALFEYSGLKNIKCYGSSMSFIGQIKTVPGVVGAATYVNSKSVKVWYDSTKVSSDGIKKSLFTPTKVHVKDPADSIKVAIVEAKVYNLFDQMDVFYMDQLLRKRKDIYAFESSFGEPVTLRMYCDYDIDLESLKESIETESIPLISGGKEFTQELEFEVSSIDRLKEFAYGINVRQYMFMPFKRAFNDRSKYKNNELASFEMVFDEYPRNKQMMDFMINHVGKAQPYVVGMVTYFKTEPTLRVFFVRGKAEPQEIVDRITEEKFKITYDNGVVEEFDNPYTFK
ncbi:MAG: 4Fe-4S binding protein [Bacteroidales bacterium]|nr:4Fe-4S binding protein [Bacteroidales bacterium]